MGDYKTLKTTRPVRHAIAMTAYRLIWWPALAVALPFALIGGFVDWLSWTAFPAIARFVQPVWSASHAAALATGYAILGATPTKDTPDEQ